MAHLSVYSFRDSLRRAVFTLATVGLAACGGGNSGGGSPPPAPVDTTPPETTIAGGPASLTSSRAATFVFGSSEAGSTFEMSVDGGAFAAAATPAQLASLADGQHSISVRARDAAGNVDASPASHVWTVDGTAPTATILFPTPVSYTDATTLHVRGATQDANAVAGVTVNGVAATSSNNFATWAAVVPLNVGENILGVTTSDAAGNVNAAAASVRVINRGQSLVSLRAMDFDAANNRVLIADQSSAAVFAMNPANGQVTTLSDRRRGMGPDIEGAEGIVVDGVANRVLLVDWLQNALLGIDLTSGNRTLISPSTASSPETTFFSGANGIALDAVGRRAFVAVRGTRSIIAVDLQTGVRSVVSSAARGVGTNFSAPLFVVYDAATVPSAARLLVSDTGVGAIFAVDVDLGTRTILSSASPNGSGASLVWPSQLQIDATQNRLLVVDQHTSRNSLVAVSLSNGNRTTVADGTTGSGDPLTRPMSLAWDGIAARAYVADGFGANLIEVNTTTLVRSGAHNSNVGNGVPLESPYGVALERTNGVPTSLLVASWSRLALLRINLTTGDRTTLSANAPGGATNFVLPTDVVLDTRGGSATQAFVLDTGNNSIFSVNLQSGARSLVSNLDASGALTGDSLQGMTLDAANNRLLVADYGNRAIYAVNLTNGARTTVSGAGANGIAFAGPADLVVDSVSNASPRILVADDGLTGPHGIISVQPTSGDRILFSSIAPTGEGLHLLSPRHLSLDAAGQRVLATDSFHQNLMSISLSNGNRIRVAGASLSDVSVVGVGPSLMTPYGLDSDFAGQVAYVLSSNRRAVIAVDLVSGDRVIVSR